MDQPGNQVSAFDCDILRSTFVKSVIERTFPKTNGGHKPLFDPRLYGQQRH
ncbi:hypothetical protein [Mesorhizobium sp. M1406]|uniref:hypothetical protein n=1 Tax=Mesorhizobium sp. M1406 TaxID=2957099 RepID=UPI003338D07F